MDKKRSFKEFFSILGDEGVRRICKEYANGGDDVTWETLSKKFNMTLNGLYKLRDYGISNAVIPPRVAESMAKKACSNQSRHAEREISSVASYKHYMYLFEKRRNFIKNFDDEKKRSIVLYYVDSSGTNLEIANSLGLTVVEMMRILRNSIIYSLIDSREVARLNDSILKRTRKKSREEAQKILDIYWNERVKRLYVDTIEAKEFREETKADWISSDEELEIDDTDDDS